MELFGYYFFLYCASCLLYCSTTAGAHTDVAAIAQADLVPCCPQISSVSEKLSANVIQVLVPYITSYKQFVNCSDPTNVSGFCIDVLNSALKIAPNISIPTVNYTCYNINSSGCGGYDEMLRCAAQEGNYDAVVGDITYTAERLSFVDFTQPYMESGIEILTLAAIGQQYPPAWIFLKPFTGRVWGTIVGSFLIAGFVLWMLERNSHPEFREKHRIQSVCWFIISSLTLMERESIKKPLAHLLMVAWVIFCGLLGTSYTAGLTSFLTATKLSPIIQDINTLINSNDTIGYRRGSSVQDYLMNQKLIPESRLRELRTPDDFIKALSNGSVAAVVDEAPYVNLFLAADSGCDYEVVGPKLTSEGFAFALRKASRFTRPLSIAILSLSESGSLQELQEKYKMTANPCPSQSDSTQIPLQSSLGLFIFLGGTLLACLVIYYAKHNSRSIEEKRSIGFVPEPSFSVSYRRIRHFHEDDVVCLCV